MSIVKKSIPDRKLNRSKPFGTIYGRLSDELGEARFEQAGYFFNDRDECVGFDTAMKEEAVTKNTVVKADSAKMEKFKEWLDTLKDDTPEATKESKVLVVDYASSNLGVKLDGRLSLAEMKKKAIALFGLLDD